MRESVEVKRLRQLRTRAEELLASIDEDLAPFLHPYDDVTFLRTPESERKHDDVNVTTTCSCLMALSLTGHFDVYAGKIDDAAKAFALVVDAPWQSSGLDENNAFTTTLVIRALGFLQEAGVPSIAPSLSKPWTLNAEGASANKSLGAIAAAMYSPKRFAINKYPPTAAVVYWFIDGVDRSTIILSSDALREFCAWAREEFTRQLSLVVARHEAMMDPIAMAMAACLCARLRLILERGAPTAGFRTLSDELKLLPTTIELESAILELVGHQTNGIWPKYFPLFHYDKAGSNFCFTFELLEAVLVEFGRKDGQLLDDEAFIKALEQAMTWCEGNRVTWRGRAGKDYGGWNSGGYLETLKKGQPESWATSVVHMFLWELHTVLSERIQQRLLVKYDVPRKVVQNREALDDFLPIDVLTRGRTRPLKGILREKIVLKYRAESEQTMRKRRVKASRSALLFGPPGTSKTDVVEAVAAELGWPLVKIDPSHFLRKGFEGIYIQAEEIFDDLMDLSGAVVLFDEMDALVQTRDADSKLDTAAQFLTTFMLPKLVKLHDYGRVVFFMATNFQHRFDAAIKRHGRFDQLLCMGPPTFPAKLHALNKFTGEPRDSKDTIPSARLFKKYAGQQPELRAQLEFYTFSEFKSLIKGLTAEHKSFGAALRARTAQDVADYVDLDSKTVTLQLSDLQSLEKLRCRFETIQQIKRIDINRDDLKPAGIEKETTIIQYLIDRRQSRVTRE